MKHISFRDIGLRYSLSPYENPVCYLKPGETLSLETEDAISGQIRKSGDNMDRTRIPFSNPVVGPIYVEGAERGKTLSVYIKEIKPAIGQGVTYLSESSEQYIVSPPIFKLMKIGLSYEPKICKIREGSVYFSDRIAIPYRPMIGTIGVAPHPENESMSSAVLPGRYGGNMDLPDVAPASTIFLPVLHKGALLYVGDVHAAQGEGEISGAAIEMPAEVQIKVDLSDKEEINWPRIETESEIMSVATTAPGRSFEDAIRTAFFELVIWMEKKYGLNRFDGIMLCSQAAGIRIGNLWTVAAKIEKRYLTACR